MGGCVSKYTNYTQKSELTKNPENKKATCMSISCMFNELWWIEIRECDKKLPLNLIKYGVWNMKYQYAENLPYTRHIYDDVSHVTHIHHQATTLITAQHILRYVHTCAEQTRAEAGGKLASTQIIACIHTCLVAERRRSESKIRSATNGSNTQFFASASKPRAPNHLCPQEMADPPASTLRICERTCGSRAEVSKSAHLRSATALRICEGSFRILGEPVWQGCMIHSRQTVWSAKGPDTGLYAVNNEAASQNTLSDLHGMGMVPVAGHKAGIPSI